MLKKTGYRRKVMAVAERMLWHPVNKGVKMQAHHLVSAKGVDIAGLSNKLEHLGYDINVLDNIVLIPSTLQGACHLKCQLHRGNHTTVNEPGDSSNDDEHPVSYHMKVRQYLDGIKDDLKDGDLCDDNKRKIQRNIDKISVKMLKKINDFAIPLTDIATHFKSQGNRGCCNKDSVGEARLSSQNCSVERNHEERQASSQRKENITIGAQTYRLKVRQ